MYGASIAPRCLASGTPIRVRKEPLLGDQPLRFKDSSVYEMGTRRANDVGHRQEGLPTRMPARSARNPELSVSDTRSNRAAVEMRCAANGSEGRATEEQTEARVLPISDDQTSSARALNGVVRYQGLAVTAEARVRSCSTRRKAICAATAETSCANLASADQTGCALATCAPLPSGSNGVGADSMHDRRGSEHQVWPSTHSSRQLQSGARHGAGLRHRRQHAPRVQ